MNDDINDGTTTPEPLNVQHGTHVDTTPTGDTIYTPPRLVPRTTKVTLYQGDDEARLKELADEAWRLKGEELTQPATLDEGDPVHEAAEEHNAFIKEAEKRAVVFTLRALGRKAWRELVRAHPARDDVKEDEQLDVNVDSFPEALLLDSIIDPPMTAEQTQAFLDDLSDAQFDKLWVEAFQLNRTVAAAPKALTFLPPTPSGDAT